MGVVIENGFLSACIDLKGAEITSLKDKKDGTEYIWTGDMEFWGQHAPVLFPIVGRVKNDEYRIDGVTYKMRQHGFARNLNFDIVEKCEERVLFRLSWSEKTLPIYPYKFELYVEYILKNNELITTYKVKNVDSRDIYFSIGAHPGFNCPLKGGTEDNLLQSFDDYYFKFEKKETASITLVCKNGLLKKERAPFLNDEDTITLSKKLFESDALIFTNLKSKKVSLKNINNDKEITFDFTGFPYLGLWSKPTGAPFVCIEPWFGHADYEDFDGDFKEREGVLPLHKDGEFCCKYSIAIGEDGKE